MICLFWHYLTIIFRTYKLNFCIAVGNIINGVFSHRLLDHYACQRTGTITDGWDRMGLFVQQDNPCEFYIASKDMRLNFDCDMPVEIQAGGPMVVNGFNNTVQFRGFWLNDFDDTEYDDYYYLTS